MKTMLTTTLLVSMLFSVVIPSMIFSAEEDKVYSLAIFNLKDKQPLRNSHSIKFSGEIGKLMQAIKDNNQEGLEELIKNGSDVNAEFDSNFDGNRVLVYAITNMRTNAVEQLIKANADVDYVDKLGRTPLSYALYWTHVKKEMVEILVAGSNIHARLDTKDFFGETPLKLATRVRNTGVF